MSTPLQPSNSPSKRKAADSTRSPHGPSPSKTSVYGSNIFSTSSSTQPVQSHRSIAPLPTGARPNPSSSLSFVAGPYPSHPSRQATQSHYRLPNLPSFRCPQSRLPSLLPPANAFLADNASSPHQAAAASSPETQASDVSRAARGTDEDGDVEMPSSPSVGEVSVHSAGQIEGAAGEGPSEGGLTTEEEIARAID